MKTRTFFLITLLLVVLTISGCKKTEENSTNNPTNTTSCLLTRVSVSDGEFCDFVYSNTGKLLSTHAGYPGSAGGYDYYYYDANNRISYSLNSINDTTYFYYNAENLLTMDISCHGQIRDTVKYEYNQSKQMIKCTHLPSLYSPIRYSIYEWGTDGNVQTERYYEYNQLKSNYTFEYDNMVNRLATERGPLFEPLNKNNITIVYKDGVVDETNTYTYDANKLPIECTRVRNNGSSIIVSNTYNCP